MARAKSHKDVEFEVEYEPRGQTWNYKTFAEAAAQALAVSASHGGEEVLLDVLIHSRAGARWWGGDYAVEEYESDPEASVSDRLVVRAVDQGRIY